VTTDAAPPVGLLGHYRPLPGVRDDLVDEHGVLREQWAHVGPVLDELGHPELVRRHGEAARLLADDGVSYRVGSGTPGATGVAWRLDPVPVLVGSAEWVEVERALVQRAELLNLVLTDSTARASCCAAASSRPRWCSVTRDSCARPTVSGCRAATSW
jgi:uncharacterized circularly permuted ATP-grasp superfamily protein